ncbi:Ig-like domain-containing protein [Pseudoxanthomonas sacheonensis]|uniref:Fibronectin type 3 domain-containing protein n=1 Tax=Pseudoxanthomonas sacheonensis TaxID=443615 RepID=A0ABU1RTA0_9GAMM|nr:Ig-like domain-containing protein [Pseudoxanthomonas sacheonensis]MDR6841145.1 fibronectin type 3 domain-containing protein [Pseudoxanthomonas sacheonensis]
MLAAAASLSGQSAELIVDEGVVVKFGDQAQLVVRDKVVAGKGIILTSQKDDQTGGQVEAAAQSAAVGDWNGFRLEKSSATYGALTLEDLAVRYAGPTVGDKTEAAVTVRGVNPSLRYVQVTDSGIGMRLLDGASPAIEGSSFLRNRIGLELNNSSKPSIAATQFSTNSEYAVLNNTPATLVTATGNWWGHSTGPKDIIANPAGQGDSVSAGVNYGSHLLSAPLLNPSIVLVAPAPYFEQSLVALQLSCVNATEYRIAENGAFAGVPFVALASGRTTLDFPVSPGDGRKTLSAQFRNASGTVVSATLTGGVLIDSAAPIVTLTNPASGSFISEPIVIEATATDGSGIKQVRLYRDQQLLVTKTSAPYTYNWDTNAVAEGTYTIRAVATDEADRTSEQSVDVTISRAPPLPDTEGPQVVNVAAGGSPLANGATFAQNTPITFSATDRSAISRIELLMNGAVVGTASGNGNYTALLNLDTVANGPHTLGIRAVDSLSNLSTIEYSITVAHAAPAAPTFTQPQNGLTTRTAALQVAGNALPGGSVQLMLNGVAAGDAVTAGTDGRFLATVSLAPGANLIQATVTDQYGTSALSGGVNVTLDVTVPASPGALTASSLAAGKIRLAWTAASDPNVVANEIYRATSDFTVIGEATKLARVSATTTTYEDVPLSDGRYFYRVVTVNSAGTPSVPTNQVNVSVDKTAPFAQKIEYQTDGAYEPSGRIYGQGRITVTVTVNEALVGAPYLSLVPEGGLPIPVDLVKQDDTHYQGAFNLGAGAGVGIANALFSARDLIGNRGTEVLEGATVPIDTQGPEVDEIVLIPAAPIKVDTSRQVTVTFKFNEPLADSQPPALQYQLSGVGRTPVVIASPQRLAADEWRVVFDLPLDAGQSAPERLQFSHVSRDGLGNLSNLIRISNEFQVYQGELPALNVPLGLQASALPGGRVGLQWQAVEGASAYQLYRQAPGEDQRTPLSRSTSASATDQTAVDGLYRYSVASVRTSNGQETQSGESSVIEVTTSRTAPGAPQNLELSLTSQGVLATWQPPVGTAPASYRLYRAAGEAITSVTGLTPIKQGLKVTQAVDASPSELEHAYAVTAVDSAGNESAISNSPYLNFSLLPVKRLEVQQLGSELPVLAWTANGNGAIGYDVYVGEGDARIKLTATPTTAMTLTDSGFTSGERRYTVEAVDEGGARQARTLVMPNVNAQIVSGLPLKRNVMNRLNVQVSNLSALPLNTARVTLALGARTFASEDFALAANGTRVASVIVGGYPDLPGTAAAMLTVESAPNEGELARVGTQKQLSVVDSALVVGLDAEEFIRGASGKVRLSVENTSEVEVELLTATGNGSKASTDLRLKLMDNDGNLLSSVPYQQVTGNGVVTLASGQTVARIGAGQRYLSDAFLMPVPANSPDQVKLRLEVDKLRYNTGQPDEISIPGMGSERTLSLSETPYYGEITNVQPVVSYGQQDITIEGRALDRATQAPVSNAPLKLAINQEGFERMAEVMSAADGSFRYVFKPTLTDSGTYQVGAIHPDMTDRPDQSRFTVNRINVNPATFKLTVPRNYAYRIEYRAIAGTGSQASGLRIAYLPEFQPSGSLATGIKVLPAAPVAIVSKQNLALPVSVSGDNTSAPSGRIVLAVLAEETGAQPLALLNVDYTLTEATPALFVTPSYVEAGLAQGQSTIENVVIENKGFVAMNNVSLALLDESGGPAPAWITLASNPVLGNIAIGEKRSVDLNIAPGAQVNEGVYPFKLRVSGDNLTPENVNVFVSVTQSGQGSVLFKAADIYTATRDKNGNLIPGLAGARVTLQNESVISQNYELTTDSFGEAFFQNLPAGSYKFRASASNHQEASGRLSIKPGVTSNQSIFLEYTLINVEWSVREVTIEDRYEITLNATFETDVPAPVVVMQPTSINLPKMAPGEVFQGELVLTNYGLIRADNVVARPPGADQYYKFEFLTQPPASLEAKQRVRLPYRVIALRPYGFYETPPDGGSGGESGNGGDGGDGGDGTGGGIEAGQGNGDGSGQNPGGSVSGQPGCYTYTARYPVACKYICANGQESSNCGSSANWFFMDRSACPVGTPAPSGSGGAGGGGWGGSGGPGYGSLPGIPLCAKGSGDCDDPGGKEDGKEGGE